jgi:C1A family cysteine protease
MKYGGTGWVRQSLDWRDHRYEAPAHFDAAPGYDLSPAFPPVYNQLQTSSCTGQASCGAYHYLARAQSIKGFAPSPLFTYFQARALEGGTDRDDGAEIRDAIKSLATDGAADEALWPFVSSAVTTKPPASVYAEAKAHLALQYKTIPDTVTADQKRVHLLSMLAHKIPTVFGISCFSGLDSDQAAETGVVPMPSANESPEGGHAIVIVGWDGAKQLYKFRNSWGAGWGDHGYGYLPAAYVENPGLASDFWALFLVQKDAKK